MLHNVCQRVMIKSSVTSHWPFVDIPKCSLIASGGILTHYVSVFFKLPRHY